MWDVDLNASDSWKCQARLSLVQVQMLTAHADNIHHSFLLLDNHSLRLLPYRGRVWRLACSTPPSAE